MPRSPLTETIKRAEGMVHYVQENLSEEEYMLFLDMVDPLPEPVQKPTKKKSSKKSAGGGGGRSRKSRSASLRQQMSSTLRPLTDIISNGSADLCVECGKVPDDNVHHIKTFLDYHPFVSTAPPAELSSNQATSGIGKGVAGDVHHAAGSGD